ncbi:MAG: NERD domain-containing protein [Anaerolineae bacterium]|nr:NERD domain-containing protein [Anaerolineae bacterium]
MAELLVANGWSTPDSLAMHLQEALPDEYIVVADPIIHRLALSTVVVGPQGLFVLHTKDWYGEIRPARQGPWRERLESGLEIRHPNPEEEARQAGDALRTFLRDEFPSLHPQVSH